MVTLLGEWTGNVGRGARGGGQGVVVKVMYESGWVRLAGNKEVPRALGARRCMHGEWGRWQNQLGEGKWGDTICHLIM